MNRVNSCNDFGQDDSTINSHGYYYYCHSYYYYLSIRFSGSIVWSAATAETLVTCRKWQKFGLTGSCRDMLVDRETDPQTCPSQYSAHRPKAKQQMKTSLPRAPACASMTDTATGSPAFRPRASAASLVNPAPHECPSNFVSLPTIHMHVTSRSKSYNQILLSFLLYQTLPQCKT